MFRATGLLFVCVLAAAAHQYRAFWADAFHKGYKNPAEVDQMIADALTAKANAIFMETRLRGGSYFLRSLEPPAQDAEYSPSFDALQYAIERAHANGIEIHAWAPVYPLWPLAAPPRDPRHIWHRHGPNSRGDDMWMTVSAAGTVSTSFDPGHPEVSRYLAEVLLEPLRHYDIDGIHLDYVRYPEDANYGWNPVAAARFNRLENRTGSPPANDARWSEFRRNQVTAFVRQLYLRAIALKPSVKVSAALITWGNGPQSDNEFRTKEAYTRVFQDWRSWLEEGIVDLAMPMNYFRESSNAAFLDRWLEYEKDRQFQRALVVGPAIYLNSIPESMAQLQRILAPSAAGNRALGVSFYSYASTNTLNTAGVPITPNAEFYKAAGEFFAEPSAVPSLPWKAAPVKGNLYGRLEVEGGPGWLADGAAIHIESDSGTARWQTTTDGTGFFGAVDLPPDRYRVRLERGGQELFRTIARDLRAGESVNFDIRLKTADFAGVIPRVTGVENRTDAAPGDIVAITGAAFATEPAWATEAPLPLALGRTQILVNGAPAAVLNVAPNRIEFQIPYVAAEEWSIVVRHAGLESAPFASAYAEAAPAIVSAARRGESLIVSATGLGLVSPAPLPGHAGAPEEPYNRTVLPVKALVTTAAGPVTAEVTYSGLMPWYIGIYQVDVRLPEGAPAGTLRLEVAGRVSAPYAF